MLTSQRDDEFLLPDHFSRCLIDVFEGLFVARKLSEFYGRKRRNSKLLMHLPAGFFIIKFDKMRCLKNCRRTFLRAPSVAHGPLVRDRDDHDSRCIVRRVTLVDAEEVGLYAECFHDEWL